MSEELTKEEIISKLSSLAAYSDEVMLLGWDESHSQGMTVKLALSEPDSGVHPFKHFTVRRGKRSGHRFICLMFEIDDDEEVVDQDKRERVEAVHKGAAIARSAGQLAANQEFQRFLEQEYPAYWKEEREKGFSMNEVAAAFIRGYCGVNSRKELDHDRQAEDKYKALRSEFVRWREA